MSILGAKRQQDFIFIFADCHKYKEKNLFPPKTGIIPKWKWTHFKMHKYLSRVASESKLCCLELCVLLLHLKSLCLCSINYFPFSPLGGMQAASKKKTKIIYSTVAEFVKAWSMAYAPSKKHWFIESYYGLSFTERLLYLITAFQLALLISVL